MLLSQLARSKPLALRLLICATANVPNGTGRARRAYAPFVMADDVCGVPGTQAWFTTRQLELGRSAARGKEPLLTLFTVVASTGAAASPSMGRLTLPSLRPLFAALNIRLGRWSPNPFSPKMRARVGRQTSPGAT
jgi:hypothetical protein